MANTLAKARVTALALVFTALVPASFAHADIASQGTVSLSLDRLFGFANSRETREIGNNAEASTSTTDFSLLLASGNTVYNVPRLAVDYAIADSVTVGGALGFATRDGTDRMMALGVTTEVDSGDGNAFVIAPRAGFILPVGGPTYLWLRGGFTYFNVSSKSPGLENSDYGFALNLEPTAAFMLAGQLGITTSVVVDLPLAGESKTTLTPTGTTRSIDTKVRNFGVMVGLVVTL